MSAIHGRDGEPSLAAATKSRVPLLPLSIAALIGVCLWWLSKSSALEQSRERDFLVDPIHFELAVGPEWMSDNVEATVRAALATIPPTPLRDDREVAALTTRLAEATGWVRSVDRLEKRYPNRLEVEVTLREPVALVESEAGLLLVDADLVVVAHAADSASYLAKHELPLVHASRPLRSTQIGHAIDESTSDAAVTKGVLVAAELAPHRAALAAREIHVALIDVTTKERLPAPQLSDVELYTQDGLPIEWGRPRKGSRFGLLEPTPDAKVRGLLRIAATHPDFANVRRVRLQFAEPSVVYADASTLGPGVVSRGPPTH